MLTVGSLFTGIGGFALGLERAGMRTLWFCEQDEFCQRVLARHWPAVPCHPDVRALVADTERGRFVGARGDQREHDEAGRSDRDAAQHKRIANQGHGERHLPMPVPYVDVLCGGFPCQDISLAGKGAGIDGARSGLWSEFARLIGELRPRYVLVENVSALLARGMGRVLGDLAALGYDAEWDCLPASAFGAPHQRDRVWLVAYGIGADSDADGRGRQVERQPEPARLESACGRVVDGLRADGRFDHATNVADADGAQPSHLRESQTRRRIAQRGAGLDSAAGSCGEPGRGASEWWAVEPDVGRVAHGIPHRVDRLRTLGNSLVPQIAEWIGRRIVSWEEQAA